MHRTDEFRFRLAVFSLAVKPWDKENASDRGRHMRRALIARVRNSVRIKTTAPVVYT